MAKGSRRSTPALPKAAAVVSEPVEEPMKTPCSQLNAALTRGMVDGRRPPNRNASMGTPSGFSQSGSITGHWDAELVKRALGCAALRPQSGVTSLPSQSIIFAGAGTPMSSHQMSPSGVSATLVKMVFFVMVAMAFGFDWVEVPGATPKKPYSGFTA